MPAWKGGHMQQTFIAIIRDEDGTQLDFQRFGCKRLATAVKNMQQLAQNSLYRACTPGMDHADIYATDYDWHGLAPAATITL